MGENEKLKLKLEAEKFYNKLFSFLSMNQALHLAGYCSKLVCDMNEEEYRNYMVSLEYLHQRGIINLDDLNKG